MNKAQKSRLAIFLATLVFIGIGTFLMIRFAKGYRPTLSGTVKGTGLLAATSFPTGAEVYLEDKLTTATDNTLNLDPGTYNIKIKKDGYHTWEKTVQIEEELVIQTSATLFPTSPSLEPLTFTGAINPIPSPDGNKVVFAVASASASTKNGLYVQELTNSPISLNRSARQITRSSRDYDYTTASYTWSPDGSEILVALNSGLPAQAGAHIVINSTRFNDLEDLIDVTYTLSPILRDWELELARLDEVRLTELPEFFIETATNSGITNLYFSPDGEKLLYQAQIDQTIPNNLTPALLASSTQPESRELTQNNWYIYDLKEDRNFFIANNSPSASDSAFVLHKPLLMDDILSPLPPAELASSPSAFRKLQDNYSLPESISMFNTQYSSIYISSVQWFPDSSHIILTSDSGIEIMEYDSTNRLTVYAGPFDPNFVYAWPDASRLVTRIQFSPDTSPNLYTIKLK